jgi:basic membrane protein A and related proteins
VKLAPFGTAVSDATKKDAEATQAKLIDGSLYVYKGEIKDNAGKSVIPAGKNLRITDTALDKMDWLTAGALGKVGG